METVDAFEYAMKMEMDGKAFYEEQAGKMPEPALARIFEELADDEQRHYQVFSAMKEGKKGDFAEAFKTKILASARNIFQHLKDENHRFGEFASGIREAWVRALEIEDKSEKFYREQGRKSDTDQKKQIWNMIADEEHKHWVAIDSVIRFLDRPNQWLEDAEWSNLEPY